MEDESDLGETVEGACSHRLGHLTCSGCVPPCQVRWEMCEHSSVKYKQNCNVLGERKPTFSLIEKVKGTLRKHILMDFFLVLYKYVLSVHTSLLRLA